MESSGNKLWRVIVWASVMKMLFAQSNENNATTGCYTGPSTIDSNTIFSTGKQYVSSAGIECSGFITAWNFCHYVIGFRDQETELWAGAWRIENSVYNFVGLNVMVFGPAGQGGQFRCLEYPVDPADWIEVSEGDYIGFFVPENGVFLGSASAQSDPGHMQLQRSEYGYVENFNVSDLEEDTATFGRALLGANIDPTAEKPATSPTPPVTHSNIPSIVPTVTVIGGEITSKPRQTPACTAKDEMSSSDIALPVVAVLAVGIIVVLLVVITVLIVILRRKSETKNALNPLPHPVGRAVDATNPTTDNGSVVYETIQILPTVHEVTDSMRSDRSEAGYSMICNPAYGDTSNLEDSDYTPSLTSPPVCNPTYTPISRVYSGSLMRYPPPQVMIKKNRTATYPGPVVPSSPPPPCPDTPPPSAPYTRSKASRPPTLSLTGHPPLNPPSHRLQSPPSPYSNPYKTPRPVTIDPYATYETVAPRALSTSSTASGNSEQSPRDGCSDSASPTVSTTISGNTEDTDRTSQ